MHEIPVTFEFEGKEYRGQLNQVSGSGNSVNFHLMVDGYYWGQLFHSENYGWQFYGHKEGLEALSEYLGNIVELWFE